MASSDSTTTVEVAAEKATTSDKGKAVSDTTAQQEDEPTPKKSKIPKWVKYTVGGIAVTAVAVGAAVVIFAMWALQEFTGG